MQARPDQQKPADSAHTPAFLKAEGDAMVQLAMTLKTLLESPAYGTAANPSWWKRHFG